MDGNIRGFATVVFDNSFKVTNIAILENKERGQLFVSMPRYKSNERDENGNVYKDVCNPITKDFREEMYGKILEAYENLQKQDQDQEREHQEFRDAPEFSVSVTPFEREGSNIKGLARIYFEDSFIVNIERKKQGQGCPYRMGWMSTRLIRKSSRRTLTWIRWYNVIPMSKRMCRRFMI